MKKDEFHNKEYLIHILFALFCILGNSVSVVFLYIAFLAVAFSALNKNVENSFCFSFFLIPNIRILDNCGVSFLVNVLIVLPLIKYLIRKAELRNVVAISSILFLIIEGTHLILLNYFHYAAAEICWLLSYVLCASILIDKRILINKRMICNNFMIGIVFSAISYLICNPGYAKNIVARVIDGSRFMAYADDPNFYSLYICLSIAILLSCKDKSRLDYISLGLVFIIGVLTASKMCILLLMFILIASICCQLMTKETEKKNHVFLFKVILGLSGAVVIFREYTIQFVNNLLTRAGLTNGFSTIDYAKLTTGRSVIASNYLSILANNMTALMFGYGFPYSSYLHEETNHGAHNTYLDFILSWGIVGTIVLLYFIIRLIKLYLINRDDIKHFKMIDWLPFITLLINFADLGCMNATMFWWVLAAAIISIGDEKVVSALVSEKETNI